MAARSVLLLAALGMFVTAPLMWSMSGTAQSADARFDGAGPVWSFRPLGVGEASVVPQRRFQPRSRAIRPDNLVRRAPERRRRSIQRQYRAPLFGGPQRAGARKAVPITRGTELGFRFRPDEREAPYGQTGATGGVPGSLPSPELQSQFRPTRPQRKLTYEELEARRRTQRGIQQMQPGVSYPPSAPAPFPGYWNRW